MFNRQRTLEEYGYDLDLSIRRRTQAEFEACGNKNKKELMVIDNCPSCNKERRIKLRASKKNEICPKCFHNLPSTILAKQNQNPVKSEKTRQRMKDNHWVTKGMSSPFKGCLQTEEAKELSRKAAINQMNSYTEEEKLNRNIKGSCTQQGISIEDFKGFVTPENTKIRQSPEGKAWILDILQKSNFTCDKCKERGGSLVAHHLNAFSSFPEQRFDPENGICLCQECHSEFHSKYGKGDNIKEQYEEFKRV